MRIHRLARRLWVRRATLDPLRTEDRPAATFESSWRGSVKARIVVVLVGMGLWGAVIEARLVQWQVVQHDELSRQARRFQEQVIAPEALRGDILDRHGRLLAYSVEADSIEADPTKVKDKTATARQLCAALGDCARGEQAEILGKLSTDRQWVPIRRSREVSPEQVERVAALKLPGILLKSDTRRYYPAHELAAHVLGFVGAENTGQAGIEYAYDAVVRGVDGLGYAEVDAHRQRLETHIERAPVPGATLELTIDSPLQHIVERELEAGVAANRARGGTAVVMDPFTGEILAMASYPTFNPNAVGRSSPDDRRNRAVQDVYEPGSTFKIVTASAALQEGVVKPTDLIDTNPGSISIPGRARPIRDTHPHGVISFEDVIVKSSNVGAVKVGLRTGAERLSRYVNRFGFGQTLAHDFPGQSRGLWNASLTTESALASVSMGYQVSVTPLQMATAVSAVANGGLLMEPHIVRAIIRNGQRSVVAPKVVRQAILPETAATLTEIMEGVVSKEGTAPAASLDEYQVAGKTGTAHKAVDGHYTDDYNASFVGFVPSRAPEFTILVVIDTPRANGYYGGVVSAPIFKRIAEAALRQHAVPPSFNRPAAVLVSADGPSLPPRAPRVTALYPTLVPVGGLTLMPDVRGLPARDALGVLSRVGLAVRVRGPGRGVRPAPEPGAAIDPGSWAVVELDRHLSAQDSGAPSR
jgi:cell division protein FtsI (penicillin-binding protein 3)